LVLVSATPYAATLGDRLRFGALAAVLRGLGPGPVMSAIVGQLVGASYRGRAGAVAEVERWIRATPRRELMRAVQAWVRRPALVDRLATIAAPTVVVAGAEDTACPRELMAAVAAGIPGATLQVIAGAGHSVQLEQPAALTAVIEALLDRLPA
jgi:3-oxoadipate enol-lactonase